jgi:flagellar FliJ protein
MSQSSTASLTLVLQQAKNLQNSIAKKVQAANVFLLQEKAQAENLDDYLKEYQEKIRGQHTCTVGETKRYRSFCAQLESALVQQQGKVNLAEAHLVQLRHSLMQQQHKMGVLKELIKKRQQHIDVIDEKKIQKLVDELSARRYNASNNQIT